MDRNTLAAQHCKPLSGPQHKVTDAQLAELLAALPSWAVEGGQIARTYSFRNYDETMAFVNGVAWMAQRQNHHPDLTVGYNRCRVAYSTHDVGGLSLNDFICAARIEALREL